ncbi:MAG TPA: tRNA-dihydrouridine synthase family protein [Phycisphaerales bacterium]|nr:tRNA-dihydrouridine synthase family protein [Phycisphaerales bacterium]
MSCESNNATPPSPAIAPGGENLDSRRIAEEVGRRGMDPRITALVPAFDAPFFQAGLAGYSDAAMRIIARRHGCPFCVTEALLDRTLLAGGRGFDKADLGELHDNIPGGEEDHPLAGQIMGSDPREMAAAALKMVEQKARSDREYRKIAYDAGTEAALGRSPGLAVAPNFNPGLRPERLSPGVESSFEVIDVNLACPVKKIEKKARGGHWLAEPNGAIAILEAVREAVPAGIPCTLKIRRAFDDTPEMAANFDRILSAAFSMGYAWATVHARTVQQKYVGPSRWDLLRDIVKKHHQAPILGSGDIWNVHEIFRMIAYTGVSGVSVARGCIGNPWIFRQARQMMAGNAPAAPTVSEQREVLRQHFELSLAVTRRFKHGEDATSKMMRKFGIRFAAHHPRAEQVRLRMIAISSTADWMNVLDEFYTEPAAV